MTMMKNFALTLAAVFCGLAINAQGQTARLSTVNITSDGERVHIAAQGDASEMRVEVSDEAGDVVFQSGAISGQTLDWKMTGAQGERVQAGTYLVTVTFRTANGKLRKRVEQVTVDEMEKSDTKPTAAPEAVEATVTTSGTTTAGKIPKFASASTVTNSIITQTAAGNIGIGIAAPSAKLHLWGTNSRLRLQSTASNVWTVTEYQTNNHLWHTGVGGSAVTNDVAGKYYIYDATAGQFRMVIGTNGNVSIGTASSVSGKLEVDGGNGTAVYATSDGSGYGVFGYSNTGYGVYGQSTNSYGVLGFSTNKYGVYGKSDNSYAGYFDGDTLVGGYLDLIHYEAATANSVPVCRNNTRLSACNSSSLRYKTDLAPFTKGLDLISRLRPISFTWKSDGSRDFGLAAEEVAVVEPFLVTHNERGEIEGVKYERLNVVLINAVKEQQAEIKRQEQLAERQQQVIARLEARLAQVERSAKTRHGSRRRSAR